ncbi:MAG: hypothetical protein QM776_09970 [Rhodocyclaceae bacterium]
MNAAINVLRACIALAIAIGSASGLAVLSAEAFVMWYMQHYGIAQRADLADDMGFGMLGLFVQSVVALLSFVVTLVIGWRASGKLAVAAGLTDRSRNV